MVSNQNDRQTVYEIGDVVVDPGAGRVRRGGEAVHLEPKAFRTLVFLIQRSGQLVAKQELLDAIWEDAFVTENALTRVIAQIRHVLGDDAKQAKYIETVPTLGYRFVAPVQGVDSSVSRAARRGCWTNVVASIVVLPLKNLCSEPEQEYFSDGMTEALTTNLAKIKSLRVLSTTSAMRFKETELSIPEIAEQLSVDAVVEGSVLQSGGRVRISAQLIDAATDEHIWAESYVRDLQNVLELQGDVARAIANEIRIQLSPEEVTRLRDVRPVEPEAYDAYLRGRFFATTPGPYAVHKAVEYFDRAIERDPGFAQAHAGLALVHAARAGMYVAPSRQIYSKVKTEATKAIQLDDSLAEGHSALAIALAWGDWDWPTAEAEFRRALELNRSQADAHQLYGQYLVHNGRIEEGISELRKAVDLDPFSLETNLFLGWGLYSAREYVASIKQHMKTLEMKPDFAWGHLFLSMTYVEASTPAHAIAEAEEAMRIVGRHPWILSLLGNYCARAGDRDRAKRLLEELIDSSNPAYVAPDQVALVHLGLGQHDEAMDWLEKAHAEGAYGMVLLKEIPWYDPLRSNPRFQKLLRCMDFPE